MTIHRPAARLAQLGLPLPNELSTEDIASLAFPNLAHMRETGRAKYRMQLGDRRAFQRLVEEAIASGSLPARTETRTPGIYAQARGNRSGLPATPAIVHIIDREHFAQWFRTSDVRALVPEDSLLDAWIGGQHEGNEKASITAPPNDGEAYDQHFKKITEAANSLGINLLSVPYGGKKRIERESGLRPAQFKKTWQKARDMGLVALE